MDEHWDPAYSKGFADKLYEEEYEPRPDWEPPLPEEPVRGYQPRRKKKKKKKKHGFRNVLLVLLVLLALGTVVHLLLVKNPGKGEDRRSGNATILLAGTDKSGDRTDTVMLLNVNRKEKRMSLMSIPRDTRVNSTYWPNKINIAYGVNGKGESGMDSLMGYVADSVGFRPDGYILVELDVFVDLVDLFGGVEFDVPCPMDYEDPTQDLTIHLEPGPQKLDGYAAMGLVRFRSGYAMADLQRVSVQRDFMLAALDQWASVWNIPKLGRAMSLIEKASVTDLSGGELLWLAESAALCGTGSMEMFTVPYYLDDTYVYIENSQEYLDLLNTYFNPRKKPVTGEDLNLGR